MDEKFGIITKNRRFIAQKETNKSIEGYSEAEIIFSFILLLFFKY